MLLMRYLARAGHDGDSWLTELLAGIATAPATTALQWLLCTCKQRYSRFGHLLFHGTQRQLNLWHV